jgi:uncharacterized membrane protein YphA (DoxX/SURF4 family)
LGRAACRQADQSVGPPAPPLALASAGLVGVLGVIMLVQGFVDRSAAATAMS